MSFGLALLSGLIVIGGARDARSQSEPALRRGPALAHGYQYAPVGRCGGYLTSEGQTLADGTSRHNLAVEAACDARLPIGGAHWLASARLPVRWTIDDGDLTADTLSLANLGLTMTYVNETAYSAEQFVGLLFPVVSIGAVIPTGMLSRRTTDRLDAFVDAPALYLEDTAALTVGTAARLDFFMFHGLFVQSGPELQLLDSGDSIVTINSGLGFGPGTTAHERIRFLFEHTWVREVGAADVIEHGKRTLFRIGVHVTPGPNAKKDALGATAWWTIPTGADHASFFTLDVHYVF